MDHPDERLERAWLHRAARIEAGLEAGGLLRPDSPLALVLADLCSALSELALSEDAAEELSRLVWNAWLAAPDARGSRALLRALLATELRRAQPLGFLSRRALRRTLQRGLGELEARVGSIHRRLPARLEAEHRGGESLVVVLHPCRRSGLDPLVEAALARGAADLVEPGRAVVLGEEPRLLLVGALRARLLEGLRGGSDEFHSQRSRSAPITILESLETLPRGLADPGRLSELGAITLQLHHEGLDPATAWQVARSCLAQ